jgi:hypothetical protein
MLSVAEMTDTETMAADNSPAPRYEDHNGTGFLTPTDLTSSSMQLNRIALIGSCMVSGWGFQTSNPVGCPVDMIVVNNISRLPKLAPEVLESYDFAVIQVTLR